MNGTFKERFIRMLYPYVIILRQGGKRPQDPFDFSLALLHRQLGETFPSPPPSSAIPPPQHDTIRSPVKSPKTPRTSISAKKKRTSHENSS